MKRDFQQKDPDASVSQYLIDIALRQKDLKGYFDYDKPYNLSKDNNKSNSKKSVHIFISEFSSERMLKLSNNSDLKLHMVIITLIASLFYKYSEKHEFILSTPAITQNSKKSKNSLLPVKCLVNNELSFKDLLLSIRTILIDAVKTQNIDLKTFFRNNSLDIDLGEYPFSDVIVILKNVQESEFVDIDMEKCNMVFVFENTGSLLEGTLVYNPSVYEDKTIINIVKALENITDEIFNDIFVPLSDIDLGVSIIRNKEKPYVQEMNNNENEEHSGFAIAKNNQNSIEKESVKEDGVDELLINSKNISEYDIEINLGKADLDNIIDNDINEQKKIDEKKEDITGSIYCLNDLDEIEDCPIEFIPSSTEDDIFKNDKEGLKNDELFDNSNIENIIEVVEDIAINPDLPKTENLEFEESNEFDNSLIINDVDGSDIIEFIDHAEITKKDVEENLEKEAVETELDIDIVVGKSLREKGSRASEIENPKNDKYKYNIVKDVDIKLDESDDATEITEEKLVKDIEIEDVEVSEKNQSEKEESIDDNEIVKQEKNIIPEDKEIEADEEKKEDDSGSKEENEEHITPEKEVDEDEKQEEEKVEEEELEEEDEILDIEEDDDEIEYDESLLEVSGSSKILYSSMKKAKNKKYYNVTPMQKRIFILHQIDEDLTKFNSLLKIMIEGPFDLKKMAYVAEEIIARHEALRTSFDMIEGIPVQVIHDKVYFEFEFFDLSRNIDSFDNGEEQDESNFNEKICEIEKRFIRPFNLKVAPLIRVGLISINSKKHIVLLDMHKIISDEISRDIILKEFILLYMGRRLSQPKFQFRDFSEYLKSMSKSIEIKRQEKYWLSVFSKEPPELILPYDYPRPSVSSFEGDFVRVDLNEYMSRKIHALARETESSVYMIFLAVYNILLSKYSYKEDVVVGSYYDGRAQPELKGIVGSLENLLPMRNYPKGNKSFREFLENVRDNALRAYNNSDYYYAQLVEKLNLKEDAGRNPLFDTILIISNLSYEGLELNDVRFSILPENLISVKYDLEVEVSDSNSVISYLFKYCVKLFQKETVEGIAQHFFRILKVVVDEPDILISDINIISFDEEKRIIDDYNGKSEEFQLDNKLIHEYFEMQIIEKYNEIALVCGDESITYGILNRSANKLAEDIISLGISQGSSVAVFARPSIDMYIGVLAILKAGCIAVPINITWQPEYIKYIINDSGCILFLVELGMEENLSTDYPVLVIEKQFSYDDMQYDNTISPVLKDIVRSSKSLNIDDVSDTKERLQNPAVIIYAYDDSKYPRGVVLSHKNIANLSLWSDKKFKYSKNTNILFNDGLSFDFSVPEVLVPLMNGATVHITGILESERIISYIHKQNINIGRFTPKQMKSIAKLKQKIGSLHILIGKGEIPRRTVIERLLNSGYKLYNIYGYPETSFDTVIWEYIDSENVLVSPVSNTKVYIVDAYGNLLPEGVVGEVWVSGDAVACGFAGTGTKRKFKEDRFFEGNRVYKTSDIACWSKDGNIRFISRKDNLVVINGRRIKPSETEKCLKSLDVVADACMLDISSPNGEKYLYAFIVLNVPVKVEDLQNFVAQRLPVYLVPDQFVVLDKIPRKRNNKPDQKILKEIAPKRFENNEYAPPIDEVQIHLVEVWKALTGAELVGIYDDFFEIGGNYLQAIYICEIIRQKYGVKITLRDFVDKFNIYELSDYINSHLKKTYYEIQHIADKEYFRLTPNQERIYVMSKLDESGVGLNLPRAFIVNGSIDKNKLEKAANKLIERHKILRTSFELQNGMLVQKIVDNEPFEVEVYYLKETSPRRVAYEIEETIYSFIRPFELENPPLIRIGLIDLSDNKKVFMFDIHSIISDSNAVDVLIFELFSIYNEDELKEPEILFTDFAEWYQATKEGKIIKEQENFWLSLYQDTVPTLNIKKDFSPLPVRSCEGDSVYFRINKELQRKLREVAESIMCSTESLLLGAYCLLIYKYSGETDIVIGRNFSGRYNPQLENIVGNFDNVLPIRSRPHSFKTVAEFVFEVNEIIKQADANKDIQFGDIIAKLGIIRDVSKNPLIETSFSYENVNGVSKFDKFFNIIEDLEPCKAMSLFDLSLRVLDEENNGLRCEFNYSIKAYRKDTIMKFAEYFVNILSTIVESTYIPLAELDIMNHEEKTILLEEFNKTAFNCPLNMTVHRFFEQVVDKIPFYTAVKYEGVQMSYRYVNEKANKIANYIKTKGLKREDIIAVIVSEQILIPPVIMGILKAGCAYLAIDPELPSNYINYMLRDSGAKMVMCQKDLPEGVSFEGIVRDVEDDNYEISRKAAGERKVMPDNIACVIYAKQDVGVPKGLMITHKNIVNYISWRIKKYGYNESDVSLQLSSITEDCLGASMLSCFLSGGTLIFPDKEWKNDIEYIRELISNEKVANISLTPDKFKSIIKDASSNELNTLKFVVFKGEELNKNLIKLSNSIIPNIKIIAEYRPGETALPVSCIIDCNLENIKANNIGKPIGNMFFYIMNKEKALMPYGFSGELCITGAGVPRGYVNSSGLTREKFVENPYFEGEGLYKTGKIAKWCEDGTVEIIGDVNSTVEIDNFNVDLTLIESRIKSIKAVKDAKVFVGKGYNSEFEIRAYFKASKVLPIENIRKRLLESLPQYMIPNEILQVEDIPIDMLGRIDLEKLNEMIIKNEMVAVEADPNAETVDKLLNIIEVMLGLPNPGIDDDFFAIGGDSIKAIDLVGHIYNYLGVNFPVIEIFKLRIIRKIALYIDEEKREVHVVDDKNLVLLKKGGINAKNMFFIHGANGDAQIYNSVCNKISENFNFWGIKADLEGSKAPKKIGIESVASDYTKSILSIQPEGPYYIAGWDIGGLLAFEIVRQLEEMNEKVDILVLLDAEPPIEENLVEDEEELFLTDEGEKRYIIGHMKDSQLVMQIVEMEDIEQIWNVVINYVKLTGEDEKYKEMIFSDYASSIPKYSQLSFADTAAFANIIRSYEFASLKYAPKSGITSPVLFLKAEKNGVEEPEIWQKYCLGSFEILDAPGNHYTIHKKDNALLVAHMIRRFIEPDY